MADKTRNIANSEDESGNWSAKSTQRGSRRSTSRPGADTIADSMGTARPDHGESLRDDDDEGAAAPESGPSGGGESSAESDVDIGAVLGDNKIRKDYKGSQEGAKRTQEQLDKYRDEMAVDAPDPTARYDEDQ
jgi:hypothetical protein